MPLYEYRILSLLLNLFKDFYCDLRNRVFVSQRNNRSGFRQELLRLLRQAIQCRVPLHRNTCFFFLDFQRAHVGLIISPIMSIRMIREIEIYWNHARYRPGDTIALYAGEPTNGLEPIYTLIPNAPSGIKRTGLQATFVPTSNLTFDQQCLRTYATYIYIAII